MRSTAAPRRARCRCGWASLFFVPGVLWLLILSRWKESSVPPSQPDRTASAEEELIEARMG